MITVDNYPIMIDEMDILQNIKEQVYLQQGREILKKIKRTGDNIMVCCPNLEHSNGQERKPSCGISLVEKRVGDKIHPVGTFHCFACGAAGNFQTFVSLCFGYNDDGKFGNQWLKENYITGNDAYERPDIASLVANSIQRTDILTVLKQNEEKRASIKYVSEEELAQYRFYHPYMYQRKLTNEVIEKYDVGYQKDFVFDKGWHPTEVLTFPVRDKDGNCLFVSRRSIYGKTFFLPLDLDKPVYGVYELPKDCKEAVICESVINALTCVVYGKPALALFGTGDQLQYDQLNSLPIRHYILALDPDKAGFKGTYRLKKALKGKYLTKYILPPKKDINDLSYEEFINLPEVLV